VKFRSFTKARDYVHTVGLKTRREWRVYCKSGKKPDDIPSNPPKTYKEQWKGWGDWLGTGTIAPSQREYWPFEKAREYARKLGLKTRKEWLEYCRSGKKPPLIPRNPAGPYKEQWKGWGDWLGTGTTASYLREYWPFEKAREYARKLGLKTRKEWLEYCRSGKKHQSVPVYPDSAYEKEWQSWGEWLGTGTTASYLREYWPFEKAREYARKLKLRSQKEWAAYAKSGEKPKEIPANPRAVYSREWKNMGEWLGTGTIAPQLIEHWSFNKAREYARKLGLKTRKEWLEYCRSSKKHQSVPVYPDSAYKEQWKGWGDWLGTDRVATQLREYWPFEKARAYAQELKLRSQEEWNEYCNSGKKPPSIPNNPAGPYKKQWKGWGDWLGTGTIAPSQREYWPFEKAREYARKLGLKSREEWDAYAKSKERPQKMPRRPDAVYKKQWKSWGDWLGTGTIAPSLMEFLPYEQARAHVHKLGIKSQGEWVKYCNSGKRPPRIPAWPAKTYKDEWIDWYDWLGYEDARWSPSNVKELLNSLIEFGIIYDWTEARLYSLLLRKGVLNLYSNRHRNFFRDLIRASRTEGGKIAIEDYAYSDSENPPDLSVFTKAIKKDDNNDEDTPITEQEIKESSLVELEHLSDGDVVDEQVIIPAEQILKNTEFLESISVDQEAMQFYVSYEVQELWKAVFKDELTTIDALKRLVSSGNKFRDLVVNTFLDEYQKTKWLEFPKNYSFRNNDGSLVKPFLMQLYIANKIKHESNFGNFSGTGAGKTLSAILASRVVGSKMTLIVSPNDVVHHWVKNIVEIFSDSTVITGNELFSVKYDPDKYKYLVMNYDKLNQRYSVNQILKLVEQRIDFLILDEIHFSKIRDEYRSMRRKNLDGLLSYARKKNPDIKILGLSATPVVNNLREGRSLLELITGKVYDDVATNPTVANAVALYEKLTTLSIRQIPEYKIAIDKQEVDVETPRPFGTSLKMLHKNPLAIEEHLTNARIEEIIKRISGQTIIYSEYVNSIDPSEPTIVQKIADAVEKAGYSFGFYIGNDRSGLDRFLKKKIQVLIASRPISTGVDGLQSICSNLIFNTLPWTHALYQQIIGRIVRTGQGKDKVTIHHIKASIGGFNYDQLKMNRLKFKKTLADCAVDGVLPESNLVTPIQAMQEAIRWLERLEKGEISCITRRELDVKLTPIQIQQRIRAYGDFTRLNQRINSERSETTHNRMLKNPEEWHEYHRQYREERKNWIIIPYEYWIKRIRELSQRYVIADFGGGEAKISQAIGSGRIITIDHVAIDPSVISCDMADVSKYIHDGDLDIALFSLSLMGKNWEDYLKEAARCLSKNGYLFISETTNSLLHRLKNLRQAIEENGFEIYRDDKIGPFTFIEARKA
jgi:superfamily II DNA or RNA helicase